MFYHLPSMEHDDRALVAAFLATRGEQAFRVTDVRAARRALEARGVTFARPTIVIPGKVALAEFADRDGNVLRFAGPPYVESQPAGR